MFCTDPFVHGIKNVYNSWGMGELLCALTSERRSRSILERENIEHKKVERKISNTKSLIVK